MCISFILALQDPHLSAPISPVPNKFSKLCFLIILDPMNGNLLISSTLSITPLHFLQDQCLSFFLRANFFVRLTSRTSWARIYLTLIHMSAWHWKYINLPINRIIFQEGEAVHTLHCAFFLPFFLQIQKLPFHFFQELLLLLFPMYVISLFIPSFSSRCC